MATTSLVQDLNYNADSMSHWISYGRHEGPRRMSTNSGCIVSIVLDDSSIAHFSAIRFLIVSKQSQNLDHLRITDCHDLDRWKPSGGSPGSPGPQTHYRTRLHRLCAASRDTAVILASPVSGLPIFTMVFELIDTGGDLDPSYGDLQLVALVPCSRLPLDQLPLRVIYERVHRVSPGNPSLLVFLDSNVCFESLPQELCDSHFPAAIRAHSIRVLPTSGRQGSFFPLHPAIIRHVVDFAIGGRPFGWRRALLAYGLVSKSWAHVLDLFFERFSGSNEFQKVDVCDVARALERRPERGALMHTLDFTDYNLGPPEDLKTVGPFYNGLEGWHAFLKILQYATSVRRLCLLAIPEMFSNSFVRGLSDLRKVQRCFSGSCISLTMADIQTFIAEWEDLTSLSVTYWAGQGDTEPSSRRLTCNVEELNLFRGDMNGRQFLRFLSVPRPRLKRLQLQYVQGISNEEFRSFLFLAAPTLSQISVSECPMPCSSPNEEFALDAVIHMMDAITFISAPGTHVSARILSRKISRTPPSSGAIRATIYINCAGADTTIGQVAEAMKVTGWEMIWITWPERSMWDEVL
ncbi:hypothetical protein FPV67DRAFT_879000 [Lyophyllum atratum]|nr:hypothetical protein FPV67DRAFT_879000 [Lyophyllum atratum]